MLLMHSTPFFLIFASLVFCKANYYGLDRTKFPHVELMVAKEAYLIQRLEEYINRTDEIINNFRKILETMIAHNDKALNDETLYMAHPINVVMLIKRLTHDWGAIEHAMLDFNLANAETAEIVQGFRGLPAFPSHIDFANTVSELMRVKYTSKLNFPELVRGNIRGKQYPVEIDPETCYVVGSHFYEFSHFDYAAHWLMEGYKRVRETDNKKLTIEILKTLTYSLYQEGNIEAAYTLTEELVKLTPEDEKIVASSKYFKRTLEKKNKKPVQMRELLSDKEVYTAGTTDRVSYLVDKNCEKAKPQYLGNPSILKCRYVPKSHPFTIIAPIKEEILVEDPPIKMFHDVITELEAVILRRLALPKMTESKIETKNGTQFRLSKSAYLMSNEHPVVAKVSQRAADITEMNLKLSEPIQVLTYGLGGYYLKHTDLLKNVTKFGNRLATFIYYLTDVDQGGTTVFPALNIEIKPIKGSAVLWFNLFPDGKEDKRTDHVACPVLFGSKWVAAKWFREHGQEFTRPCGLKPN